MYYEGSSLLIRPTTNEIMSYEGVLCMINHVTFSRNFLFDAVLFEKNVLMMTKENEYCDMIKKSKQRKFGQRYIVKRRKT